MIERGFYEFMKLEILDCLIMPEVLFDLCNSFKFCKTLRTVVLDYVK